MPYSDVVRLTRLWVFNQFNASYPSIQKAYRAISPRFAINTEVSGLTTGATVELRRIAEAPLWLMRRDRWVGFRRARIITRELLLTQE